LLSDDNAELRSSSRAFGQYEPERRADYEADHEENGRVGQPPHLTTPYALGASIPHHQRRDRAQTARRQERAAHAEQGAEYAREPRDPEGVGGRAERLQRPWVECQTHAHQREADRAQARPDTPARVR